MENQRKQFLAEAEIETFAKRADKSIKITFATQEASQIDLNKLEACCGTFGVLYFTEGKITEEDKEILDEYKVESEAFKKPKTQSQHIRHLLFRIWENTYGEKSDWEIYYKSETNKYIETLKEKLKGLTEPEITEEN